MHLQHLTAAELTRARDAADYLLGLDGAHLDAVLRIKLDTFRADVTAAIEDREPATLRQP
jgi:hypothetical protein